MTRLGSPETTGQYCVHVHEVDNLNNLCSLPLLFTFNTAESAMKWDMPLK